MNNHFRGARLLWAAKAALFSAALLFFPSPGAAKTQPLIEPRPWVAHAGGGINGMRYTNSREALDENYARGFRLFEVDLELTRDHKLVLLHDWDYSLRHFFNHARPGQRTLKQLRALRLQNGLTVLTFAELSDWLDSHSDAAAIIDSKRLNYELLKKISANFPRSQPQIIPQIYSLAEYQPVRRLGFKHIILTLYARPLSDAAVMQFVKTHPLFAVTMPAERARRGNLAAKLLNSKIFVYAHLVDNVAVADDLLRRGVQGFYTAFLKPS